MQDAALSVTPIKPRILVVEDERVVAMDLAGTLKELGYQVAGPVARSEEAIRCAVDQKPNLILMDVRLAGDALDGIQIAEVIHRSQDVPVIYLTAHSDDDTVRRAANTSASGYLVKPFKTPELRSAIEIALHKHAADQNVRRNEHWLSTTLESIAEAVIATDDAGCVKLFNAVAEKMTGWDQLSAREQPLHRILSIVHEDTGKPLGNLLEAALNSGQAQQHNDAAALVTRSGHKILVKELAAPIADRHGQILGAVLVLSDITEFRSQLQEIQRLNEDLERRVALRTAELQSANRELESFSYSVAHDLRAPLRSIDSFSKLLCEEHAAQLDSKGLHFLARVRASVARMSELIDALLSLAGIGQQELDLTNVDVAAITREVAHEIAGAHRHAVEFQADFSLTAVADARLVRIVLRNLLDNAWKFTSDTPGAKITMGTYQVNELATVFVRDNGAGFDPRYKGKLFEPFQRLHHDRQFPGTGIGLAIVERAVRRLGGSVWADSQAGHGATFFFTLPMRSH